MLHGRRTAKCAGASRENSNTWECLSDISPLKKKKKSNVLGKKTLKLSAIFLSAVVRKRLACLNLQRFFFAPCLLWDVRCSILVSNSACHAENTGAVPGGFLTPSHQTPADKSAMYRGTDGGASPHIHACGGRALLLDGAARAAALPLLPRIFSNLASLQCTDVRTDARAYRQEGDADCFPSCFLYYTLCVVRY